MTSATSKVRSLQSIARGLAPVFEQGGALRVIAFGSYARGEADEFSDLDLLIVANTDRPFIDRFKDYMGVWRAAWLPVDLFVYTQQELDEMVAAGNGFVTTALAEGKVIYEARSGKRSAKVDAPGGARPRNG